MDLQKGESTGAEKYAHHVESGKGVGNGWEKRQKKRACGEGIQGMRGTLGSTSRAERKRSAGTGGGGCREWEMSRWAFKPIPEERGRVGCNRAVKIILMVAEGGKKDAGRGGGKRIIQKTADNGGAETRLGRNNSDRS